MSPEQLAALVSVPAAIAVIVTVGLFLKYMAEQRQEDRLAYAEQRALDRTLIENHLSKAIDVQADTAKTLSELVTSIKLMSADNMNSMTWARDSMKDLIREIGRSSPAKD
jgi:hypothetical protein